MSYLKTYPPGDGGRGGGVVRHEKEEEKKKYKETKGLPRWSSGLRICPAMQGPWVQPLIWEDST